ncbi:TspO/MBR family protein [Methanocella sp. MCL-LM]|uniref:TspO/MBR family protein n=1 Tax=Methanocella sp. MCL-LM TaxID=3412035 RepID=UPI003C75E4D0
MDRTDWVKLAASLAICFVAALLGSIPISLADGVAWQNTLDKPFFAPPDWLFGPAWTLLFILMAVALFLVWRKWPAEGTKLALGLFAVQIVLNVLWNYIFFGGRMIFGGLIEIVVLLVAIAATTWAFYKVDRRAAYLMVPYLLWVCFATALNAGIWLLNR